MSSNEPMVAGASDRNKWVAALLAFVLGGFGIHKFYLGRTKAGVIMLILTLTIIGAPISAIIAFIEFIIYLVKDEQRFHEEYVVGDRAWF